MGRGQDLHAELNARSADAHSRTGGQPSDLGADFPAECAPERGASGHGVNLGSLRVLRPVARYDEARQGDAFVADGHTRSGDEFGELVTGRTAERAREIGAVPAAGSPFGPTSGRLHDLMHALVAQVEGIGDLPQGPAAEM